MINVLYSFERGKELEYNSVFLRGGGGLWKISNENYIEHKGGANHFLDLLVSKYKKTRDSLMLSKS